MNIEKLKKITGIKSEEKLFGITEFESSVKEISEQAIEVENYDDDSISNMTSTCETAAGYLVEAANKLEDVEDAIDEWKYIALDLWEKLDNNEQVNYIANWSMSDIKWDALKKAFKLEDLKKL